MSDNVIDGEFKFNNCKYRSAEKRTTVVHRCACQGGNYEDSGYDCSARKIFKVNSSVCDHCYMFERKESDTI